MSDPPTPDTASAVSSNLLDRLRAHEPEGWQKFVNLYAPLVYYWCRKGNLPAAEAAEVAQEVFRSVQKHAPDHRHNSPGDTLRSWLLLVTRSKVADHIRKRAPSDPARSGEAPKSSESSRIGDYSTNKSGETSRRMTLMQAEAAVAEEHSLPRSPAIADLVRRAVQQLQSEFDPVDWQAFWRVTVDGHAPAEVAADLKMKSTIAVYQAKSRVMTRLRDELGDRLG